MQKHACNCQNDFFLVLQFAILTIVINIIFVFLINVVVDVIDKAEKLFSRFFFFFFFFMCNAAFFATKKMASLLVNITKWQGNDSSVFAVVFH